jgi:hypothetical protein
MKAEAQGQKLTFACSCNGCRNYPTRPGQIWHESQIANRCNGYYFSRDTMKMFSSRISDFKAIGVNPGMNGKQGELSLMVIVSSRYDIEGAARYYEIVTICPFGEVSREWDSNNEDPILKYPSLAKARASRRWMGNIAAMVCNCHGCQLDRAGR